MQRLIGNIALDFSFVIYLFLYLPQIIYNLRYKRTEGLSFLMHLVLLLGYISDLMYGFGRHMQWQYRLVSLTGLTFLGIQHIQIGWYQKVTVNYLIATVVIVGWLAYVLYAIFGTQLSPRDYINAGYIAWLAWVIYILPQLFKNYRLASTVGMSIAFVFMDVLASSSDTISAWCLNWDLPSKLSGPAEAVFGLLLLAQAYYFRRNQERLLV